MSPTKKRRRPTTSRRRPAKPNPMQPGKVGDGDRTRQAEPGSFNLLDLASAVADLYAQLQANARAREIIEAKCGVMRMREEHLSARIEVLRRELALAC